MIVNAVCGKCLQPFRLVLQASDVALVSQIAQDEGRTCPCPRLCGGKINLVGDAAVDVEGLRDPMNLTGAELYKAVQGAGLPDELPQDVEIISSMLLANRLREVIVEKHNTRFYLHELRLENGVTLHLTAGPRGAMVLKITKEREDGVQRPG